MSKFKLTDNEWKEKLTTEEFEVFVSTQNASLFSSLNQKHDNKNCN